MLKEENSKARATIIDQQVEIDRLNASLTQKHYTKSVKDRTLTVRKLSAD
jgi:hypothetical protein